MESTENSKITSHELWVILFVLSLFLGNMFAIDMYVPSLPAIEKYLAISQSAAQYTISAYILGMGLSVLFFGPLSDVIGRKKLIYIGLTFNIIGSIFCFMAMTPHALLVGRILQGVGAGAVIGAARAIISDKVSGKKFAIIGSYASCIMAISPIAAPIIGGYLQTYFNWRANFVVLAAYNALLLLWCLFIPETNKHQHLHSFNLKSHLKNYAYLLAEPVFMVYAFCGGFAVSVSIVYATSGPFILQNTLHLTPLAFGWMSVFIGVANIVGKFLTPPLIKRYDMAKTMSFGLFGILLSGLILIFALFIAKISLFIVIFTVMLSLFGQGLSLSNAMALGVSPYRHMGGTANALWTFIQMALAFLLTCFLSSSLFRTNQALGLANAYLIIGVSTLLIYFGFKAISKK